MEVESECMESTTISFEWALKGLKNLFDSTKGDKKSKVTKSVRFGTDRWQVLFYPNAGQQKEGNEGGFISLFLSCEPTPEEKEAALATSGKWVRDGIYRFSFELKNTAKTVTYGSKEANNHTFTYKTANWGWPQFARRDSVYYQNMQARTQDAFVIVCTITSSPTSPPLRSVPRQPIPKTLLDTVGELLDDPAYSDVRFIISKRRRGDRNARTIWASKKLLQRAEHFQSMFSSNFIESSVATFGMDVTPRSVTRSLSSPSSTHTNLIDEFDDSDDEDEELFMSSDGGNGETAGSYMLVDSTNGAQELSMLLDSTSTTGAVDSDKQDAEGPTDMRSSSPTTAPSSYVEPKVVPVVAPPGTSPTIRIEVRDVAYTTYRAMLYYLYTDNIVFAPLSSSFNSPSVDTSAFFHDSTSPSTPSEGCEGPGGRGITTHDSSSSRAEWIRSWMRTNPNRPAPCSAKSMYRLSDRLDLADLKERATQHIIKSLTVENIAYEIFSPFAATYEDIRKTEVDFFLSHWNEIRSSDAMKNVWVQIRNGRHPGFEEVWPLIAQSLEFKPMSPSSSQGSRHTEPS